MKQLIIRIVEDIQVRGPYYTDGLTQILSYYNAITPSIDDKEDIRTLSNEDIQQVTTAIEEHYNNTE